MTQQTKTKIKEMNEKFTRKLPFIRTDTDAEQNAFSEKIYAFLNKQSQIIADADVAPTRYPQLENNKQGGRK